MREQFLQCQLLTVLLISVSVSQNSGEYFNITTPTYPTVTPDPNAPAPTESEQATLAESEGSTQAPEPANINTSTPEVKPSVLQEVSQNFTFPIYEVERERDRPYRPHRIRGPSRRRYRPDGLLEKLADFGSKFFSRSLSLLSGDKVRDGNRDETKGRAWDSEFSSAVGRPNKDTESEEDKLSFNDKWKDLNPVQQIMGRFDVKQEKVQRWRQVKDEYRQKEQDRKVAYFGDTLSDDFTKHLKNLVWKFVNKYHKNTETMQVWVDYRRQKLKQFMEIPLVASMFSPVPNTPVNDTITSTIREDTLESDPQDKLNDYETPPDQNRRRFFSPLELLSRKLSKIIEAVFA